MFWSSSGKAPSEFEDILERNSEFLSRFRICLRLVLVSPTFYRERGKDEMCNLCGFNLDIITFSDKPNSTAVGYLSHSFPIRGYNHLAVRYSPEWCRLGRQENPRIRKISQSSLQLWITELNEQMEYVWNDFLRRLSFIMLPIRCCFKNLLPM